MITMSTERVKSTLIRKKMSISDLAEEIGMSRTHLSRMINGRAEATEEVIGKLAEILEVTQESIVNKRSMSEADRLRWKQIKWLRREKKRIEEQERKLVNRMKGGMNGIAK